MKRGASAETQKLLGHSTAYSTVAQPVRQVRLLAVGTARRCTAVRLLTCDGQSIVEGMRASTERDDGEDAEHRGSIGCGTALESSTFWLGRGWGAP